MSQMTADESATGPRGRPRERAGRVREPRPASWPAHSAYQAELGMELPQPFQPRQTPAGQPTVADLLRPGAWVRTNYSGPYRVLCVTEHEPFMGWVGSTRRMLGQFRTWSITCNDFADYPSQRQKDLRWLNDYVAVAGRVLHFFPNNTDEVFLLPRRGSWLRNRGNLLGAGSTILQAIP